MDKIESVPFKTVVYDSVQKMIDYHIKEIARLTGVGNVVEAGENNTLSDDEGKVLGRD